MPSSRGHVLPKLEFDGIGDVSDGTVHQSDVHAPDVVTSRRDRGVSPLAGTLAFSHIGKVDVVLNSVDRTKNFSVGGKRRGETRLMNTSINPFGMSRFGFE